MRKKKESKLKRTIEKACTAIEVKIDYAEPVQCRKCLYHIVWRVSCGEFDYYTDKCLIGFKGCDKLFCIEGIKQRAEKPNMSLHNYAMSYVEQEKMKGAKE